MTSILTAPARSTANDRFKRGFASWFWVAMILATAAHFTLFLATPSFGIEDASLDAADLDLVPLPERIDIPPPPTEIARPAAPVIADDPAVDVDLTIPRTTPDAYPDALEPPAGDEEVGDTPTFFPMTVAPRLLNPREVAAALERHYPPLLRDAGIGATVTVWFFIDEAGRVMRTQIDGSSGYEAFDQAALAVADRMEFSPALNRDQRVHVWVSIPIRFEVQR